MKTSKTKLIYLAVYVDLLLEIFLDKKKAIDKIIAAGVLHFSNGLSMTTEEAWERVLYLWLEGEEVPEYAEDVFEKFAITRDDCFPPEIGFTLPIQLGLMLYRNEIDSSEVFHFGRFVTALKCAGIQAKYPYKFFQFAESVVIEISSSRIFGMLNKDVLYQFRDHPKTDFELAQLAVYCALKSIQGKRKWAKTNIHHVMTRAFHPGRDVSESDLCAKYSTRRRFDRIKEALQLHWTVKIYAAHIRGFFFTTSPEISLIELATIGENSKLKNKRARLRRELLEAQAVALEKVSTPIKR